MIRALFIVIFTLLLAIWNSSQSDSSNNNAPGKTNIRDPDNSGPTMIMVAAPPRTESFRTN